MSLFQILTYIRNAPNEEIEIYNKLLDILKNNCFSEDPSDDNYINLQELLIHRNKIWYDIIHGKYGFFDKILR
jgi:hypothetical protein